MKLGWKSVEPLPKVNYPVVLGDWDFRKLVGVTALPVTLLIDRDGELAVLDVVVSGRSQDTATRAALV